MDESNRVGGFSKQKSNYESWLDRKPFLEKNEELHEIIYQILSNKCKERKLGSGYAHSAYELGSILNKHDAENLALRVASIANMSDRVFTYNLDDLKSEISRFDEARDEIISNNYNSNSNNAVIPLSFAGVVALHTKNLKGEDITKYAIITEDISKGRVLGVSAGSGDETAIVKSKSGDFLEERFMDPARSAKDISRADKYLDYDSMLNIYRR